MATVTLQLTVQEDRLEAVKELINGIKGVKIENEGTSKEEVLAGLAPSIEEVNLSLMGGKQLPVALDVIDRVERELRG